MPRHMDEPRQPGRVPDRRRKGTVDKDAFDSHGEDRRADQRAEELNPAPSSDRADRRAAARRVTPSRKGRSH